MVKSNRVLKEIKLYIAMMKQGNRFLQEKLDLFRSRKKADHKQINDMHETLNLLEYKYWYYEEASADDTEQKLSTLSIDDIPEPYRNA